MGIGKKITKGSIGGGVNISHKSKMSQSAKNQMSFPGGMPGPGDYGKVVGKGMAKYLSGESVGMKKYGKHKGTAKMDPMHNGEPGVQKEDFQQFSDGAAKYGQKKKKGKLPKAMKDEAIANKKKIKGKGEKVGGPMKREKVKSVKQIGKAKLSSEAEGEMINSNFVSNDPKGKTLNTTIKPKSKRKPSKEIGKSKIEEGKKLKKEGRQEKRAAKKDARKLKRSARLDKKIALQEFKGKQKLKSGDKLGAKAKQDRIANLKARKAKK